MSSHNIKRGFTLVELLIVIAILSILSTLGLANFQTARSKARDLTRKSDLQSIAKSLEAYANDHRGYPLSDATELTIVCKNGGVTCDFGTSFTDNQDTIYLVEIPADPFTSQSYAYISDGTTYTLYAHLENTLDPSLDTTITTSCGNLVCNYALKSSNNP